MAHHFALRHPLGGPCSYLCCQVVAQAHLSRIEELLKILFFRRRSRLRTHPAGETLFGQPFRRHLRAFPQLPGGLECAGNCVQGSTHRVSMRRFISSGRASTFRSGIGRRFDFVCLGRFALWGRWARSISHPSTYDSGRIAFVAACLRRDAAETAVESISFVSVA